jgi:uncharacterized protein (TIGR00725 family)
MSEHRELGDVPTEEEALRADDSRARIAEQARDVAPGEATAADQRLSSFGMCAGIGESYHRAVPQISVIGSGRDEDPRAEEVGRLLAERGGVLVCGGLGGVMAAAARGAKAGGGTTIGILPGESRREANPWIDHAVVTGIGHARNLAVVASGDAVIAVSGEWGTLAEIGLARKLGRPVVVLEPGWELAGEGIERAATPAEAVDLAIRLAGG